MSHEAAAADPRKNDQAQNPDPSAHPTLVPPQRPVWHLYKPRGEPVALVFDSPHSSDVFPEDFGHAVTEFDLREAEDCFIGELYRDGAAAVGGVLLEAGFSRTYIDPNRAAWDIDLELVEGEWNGEYRPSGKARLGKATIWRLLEDGRPIYARRLPAAEVRHRVESYLIPYQKQLKELLDAVHARHGVVYHVNCHSMSAVSGVTGEDAAGTVRADIVLGDRDGTTCSGEFTELVRQLFADAGYHVKVNEPYKGVELVRAFSDPAAGRHSLQIEINKRLYMDEARREKHAGFEQLQSRLDTVLAAVAAYAREQSR